MFFIDYEKFYGIRSTEISGSRPAPTRNSAEGDVSVDGNETDEVAATGNGKQFGGLNSIASKAAGGALSAAKGAIGYARSDEAAAKMNDAKDKLRSGAAGAGAMLSGIGSKASGFMSSKKRHVGESSQYAEMDPDEVRYSETFGTSTGFGQNNVNKILIAVIAVLVVGMTFMGGAIFMLSRNNKEKPVEDDVIPVETTAAQAETSSAAATVSADTPIENVPIANENKITAISPEKVKEYPQYIAKLKDIAGGEVSYECFDAEYFFLSDINGDNTPELFVTREECDGFVNSVYSIYNSSLVQLAWGEGSVMHGTVCLYDNGVISYLFGIDAGRIIDVSYSRYNNGSSLNSILGYTSEYSTEIGDRVNQYYYDESTGITSEEDAEKFISELVPFKTTPAKITDYTTEKPDDKFDYSKCYDPAKISDYPQYLSLLNELSVSLCTGKPNEYFYSRVDILVLSSEIENVSYSLIDINNDKTPELIILDTSHIDYPIAFATIKNGQLIMLDKGQNGGAQLNTDGTILRYGVEGARGYYYYRLTQDCEMEFIEGAIDYGSMSYTYKSKNGIDQAVSKEYFEEILANHNSISHSKLKAEKLSNIFDIEKIKAENPQYKMIGQGSVKTESTGLNLRSEPNTNSQVIKIIPKGEYVDIYQIYPEWYYVSYEGACGYVSAQYIEAHFY